MTTKKEKVVRITENDLVELINKIVTEAVAEKKKEWLSEQKKAGASLLEGRIAKLEKSFLEKKA